MRKIFSNLLCFSESLNFNQLFCTVLYSFFFLTIGLTIFALQTKIDFTAMGGALLVALLCLMMLGLFAAIFRGNNILNLVYASLGAFIFGMYIIFDTQMMMGGKHK